MSLLPFNDQLFEDWPFGTSRHNYWPVAPLALRVPLLHENHALSRFLQTEFKEMKDLERQMMDVQTKADGKSVTFACNVAGYLPNELKVDVEGQELVIKGEHKENKGGQSIHRTFQRRIKLPEGVAKESIQCNLDDKGQLMVQADGAKSKSYSIPIGSTKAAIGKDEKGTA